MIDPPNYSARKIPVVFILTCGASEQYNADLLSRYRESLENYVGPTQTLISGDTLQVSNYEIYHWTMFDPHEKKKRRETVFPGERQKAFELGAAIMKNL